MELQKFPFPYTVLKVVGRSWEAGRDWLLTREMYSALVKVRFALKAEESYCELPSGE
jgi:hypothetical protein